MSDFDLILQSLSPGIHFPWWAIAIAGFLAFSLVYLACDGVFCVCCCFWKVSAFILRAGRKLVSYVKCRKNHKQLHLPLD